MSRFMEGLVSIITPAYNASVFLGETIESVISQSSDNWEMLIVDDCSRDKTQEIIKSYAENDQRIKCLSNNKNCGPAMSRNIALESARGQFIAFLDSDDIWLSNKLEKQLKFMKINKVAFSFTEFRRVTENGACAGHLIRVPEVIDYHGALKNTAIPTSTVVLDRTITGDFKMVITHLDDFVLWLEILKRGFLAYGMNEDLMRYRVVGRSVSRNKVRSSYRVWRTYRDIEHLEVLPASWFFVNYAWNAFKKYRRF